MTKPKFEDLAYAAGIIDGEGCIGIYGNKDKRIPLGKYYRLTVQVGMSDKEPVEFLYRTFGGSLSEANGRKPTYRTRYHWCLAARQARKFLELVKPYLKSKQNQAELAITFQGARRKRGGTPYATTREELICAQEFVDELKSMKRRLRRYYELETYLD